MTERLRTPKFRGSYVCIITPKKQKGDANSTPKYSMLCPLKKSATETKVFLAKLEKRMMAVAVEKLGKAIPKERLKHWPIIDGDKPNDDGEVDPALKGCWCIRATSKRKPKAINMEREPLTTEDEAYSGAWYVATLNPYAWNNEFGKGVSIDLQLVLKVKDDEQIGANQGDPEEEFEDLLDGGGEDGGDEEVDDLL